MKRLYPAFLALIMVLAALAPHVPAGAPEPVFPAPFNVKNTVTGLSGDVRARMVAAVVDVDVTAGGILGGDDEHDVYLFDFSDSGGKRYSTKHHADYRTGVPTKQVVAFAAGERNLDVGRFIVGGPGNTVSRWNTNGQQADWVKETEVKGTIADVAITSDAARSVVAVNPTQGPGRVFIYNSNGNYVWDVNLTTTAGAEAKATTLEMGRQDARSLVIGHDRGLWILNPTTPGKPSSPFSFDTDGAVTAIDMSHDGQYVLAGTSEGCFYYFGPGTRGENPAPYNLCLGNSGVTSVAMSLDGARFAVATADGTVHFYERMAESTDRALPFADPATKDSTYSLGKRIVQLDYNSDASLLVAATTEEVVGFHSSRVSPMWRAGAADLKLDAPLRGALVSDSGDRVVVAGNTLVTALKVVYDGNVTTPGGLARSALPGDTVRYTFVVKNTGSAPDTYTWRITPPAGWSYDPPRALTLLPDQSESISVNLTSPSSTRPGYAETTVEVESQGKRAQGKDPLVKRSLLNITVNRQVDVALEASETEVTLNQGTPITFPFTVRNNGNDDVLVNLTAIQDVSRGPSWSIRFDQDQIRVGPDGVATTSATITAPQDGYDGDYNHITIRARVGTTFATELPVTARVNPEYDIALETNATEITTRPGRTTFVKLTVTNNGNTADTVNVTANVGPADARGLWRVTLDLESLDIPRGQTRTVNLGIRAVDPDAATGTVTITATSLGSGEQPQVTVSMVHDDSPEKKPFLQVPFPAPAFLAALFAAAALATARPLRRNP